MLQAGNLQEALDKLFALEKQARNVNPPFLSNILQLILVLYFSGF